MEKKNMENAYLKRCYMFYPKLLRYIVIIIIIDFGIEGYTELEYFDKYTGIIKTYQYFGHIPYSIKIEETDYSIILKDYGFSFNKNEEWVCTYKYRFTLYLGPIQNNLRSYWYKDVSMQLANDIQDQLDNKTITKDCVVQLLSYNIFLLTHPPLSDEWNIFKNPYCLTEKIERFPYKKVLKKDFISPPKGYTN